MLIFSEPYLENRLILVGRHGDDVSATTLAALQGKRIAIVEGYSYGDTIDKAGPTFVRTSSEEESVAQLLNSTVDYTLMDELVVRYINSTYAKEAQSRLQFGSTSLITRPLHLALRNDLPGAQSIIHRFNAQLRVMITDRTIYRLLHVDWIDADVDGDGIRSYPTRRSRGHRSATGCVSITTTTEKAATHQPSGKEPGFTSWQSLHRLGQRSQTRTQGGGSKASGPQPFGGVDIHLPVVAGRLPVHSRRFKIRVYARRVPAAQRARLAPPAAAKASARSAVAFAKATSLASQPRCDIAVFDDHSWRARTSAGAKQVGSSRLLCSGLLSSSPFVPFRSRVVRGCAGPTPVANFYPGPSETEPPETVSAAVVDHQPGAPSLSRSASSARMARRVSCPGGVSGRRR